MSEQSGPITREQVERAIDAAYDCNAPAVYAALGAFWYEREDIPADVRDGWRQVGYLGLRIALTRWHAELAAAEPARRVARWDAELEAYALTPIHDDGHHMTHAVEDAAKARDWGYEIEGGPEPVRDWKSDRAIAAIWPIDIGYVPTDRERYPERPAPRFKVGDRPEVVDVPQPRIVVKRCDEVEAEWTSADATILIVTHDALDDAIFVPIALLRAMLEAIDAQQGGA